MLTFDTATFFIFGIPPYFFCAVVGLAAAVCLNIVLIYSKKYCLQEHMKVLMISIVSMLVFAKLFGCISGVYRAIGDGEKITLDTIKNTGIVFYGGLFGLLLPYHLCLKIKLVFIKERYAIDILAVSIPLFHAISRMGCFFAGCCYGVESDLPIAINYIIKNNGVIESSNRIPVQLIEAIFNMAIFIYLFSLVLKPDWKNKKLLTRYIALYSCGRFCLEFIRGDSVRGVIYGLSFSQLISIILWMVIIILSIRKKHREKEICL